MSTAISFQPVVVFENDDLIVVSKPAGIASIPERGETGGDLQNLLSKHVGEKVFVVHRLDKGVTGLIIYAKNADTHKFLNDQFAARKIQKTYIALVHGVVKEKKGTISKPLKKFGSGRMGIATGEGIEATTRYELMERFRDHTLLRAYPETGRRHQIRVHLYSLGHPIVGDPLYGDPALQKNFPHILLHAHEIEFESAPGVVQHLTTPLSPAFTEVRRHLAAPLD